MEQLAQPQISLSLQHGQQDSVAGGHLRPHICESNLVSGCRPPQVPSISAQSNPPVRYEVQVQAKAFLYEISASNKGPLRQD